MKIGESLLVIMAIASVCVIPADLLYTSRFVPRFKKIEKERIVTSNQLATAKIVSENLNHVRDLVFRNMEFSGHVDSLTQESIVFDFLTSCVNDLKMRLITVKPAIPTKSGRVSIYGYDITLEGDYFSFGELCSKLENSQRVLAITSFEVSQSAKENTAPADSKGSKAAPRQADRGSVTIKIHLDTFRVKKGA